MAGSVPFQGLDWDGFNQVGVVMDHAAVGYFLGL